MTTFQDSEFVQGMVLPGEYNLNFGMPSPNLLPVDLLNRAPPPITDPSFLSYTHAQGYRSFRQVLANFLQSETGTPLDPDGLIVTAGNSSAIQLAATRTAWERGPGAVAIVESPSYLYGLDMLRHAGFRLVSVPVDEYGLDVGALEALLENGLQPALVYAIPNSHNPTGASLSLARMTRLVELAEAHNFLILLDDPYQLLPFDDAIPRPSFADLDTSSQGVVLSAGSFSKIFAPAVRLGWLHARPERLAWLLDHPWLESGGGLNAVMAWHIAPLLQDGSLAAYLAGLRQVLARRRTAMVDALRTYLPAARLFLPPAGGYFTWSLFPTGTDTQALAAHVYRHHRVQLRPGALCNGPAEGMRLSFAFHTSAEITEAIRRIGEGYDVFAGVEIS